MIQLKVIPGVLGEIWSKMSVGGAKRSALNKNIIVKKLTCFLGIGGVISDTMAVIIKTHADKISEKCK